MDKFIEVIKDIWPLVLVVLGAIAYTIYKLKWVMPDMERRLKKIESKTEDGFLIQSDIKDDDGNPLFTAAKVCHQMREECIAMQTKKHDDFCDKVDKMEKKLSKQIDNADHKRELAKTELSKTVSDLSVNVAKVTQKVDDLVLINEKNNINSIMEKLTETIAEKLSGVKEENIQKIIEQTLKNMDLKGA